MIDNNNINNIELVEKIEGVERQAQLLYDILDDGTLMPKTLTLRDYDDAFKKWVEEDLRITSDDGREFPTMVLYTNQRFSEYTQSWKFTDRNNNIILNFKTITRNQNPSYGTIQNKLWNIPGDRFYLMKRYKRLDDNGTESFLDFEMKQPTAIDLTYTLSIFTTKYESINEFNMLINRLFNSRQCYIRPNNHYTPMTLGEIQDISEKSIDDRRFYAQEYSITVMGYIITEDDYRITETPLKKGFRISAMPTKRHLAEVEVEECEEPYNPYYYKPIIITINFDKCIDVSKFTFDTDFKVDEIVLTNILNNYKIFKNGELVEKDSKFTLKNGDEVKIMIKRRVLNKKSTMVINGYNPLVVLNEEDDNKESSLDETNTQDVYEIN